MRSHDSFSTVTGSPTVVTKDLVLEERSMLPPNSIPGVTVGRHVESVVRLAASPESSNKVAVGRHRRLWGHLVVLGHPLECRCTEGF